MKKRLILSVPALVVAGIVLWWFFVREAESKDNGILISPTFGTFDISVTTTGELQAKNSTDIRGPEGMRAVGIYQLKITNLVSEGTSVKPGDFVAELDPAELTQKIREAQLNIQKQTAEYTKTKLDTALTLSAAREEMVNFQYGQDERKLIKEQSLYEAPAVRRQVDLDYEKAENQLKQARINYKTKIQQAIAKMQSVEADLSREQSKLEQLMSVGAQFRVTAPTSGIVIYAREWNGKKRLVGSTVSAWDPAVATLPDLDTMESITYVNEVDIQKLAKGQKVSLGLDSDPDKKLTGVVTNVASIGEQRPNSDSKVFEVRIVINERDTSLRPSMTTSNVITVASMPNKLSVPLECLHSEHEITYVYKQESSTLIKQEVRVGLSNDNAAIIEEGVAKTDKIYISLPPENDRQSA
ncbi:MAG TPA: efflux RND transporter periplasmic adaptor subunit, partial [Saprospiraceae bacterium]|nr:efflux RND transporter periplasmic adaptor subunit [Saprospiraceae bacterium]